MKTKIELWTEFAEGKLSLHETLSQIEKVTA